MDPDYLPFIIEMLVYSFESDYDMLVQLLDIFKGGCMQIYGQEYNLVRLIEAVTAEEIKKNRTFFGGLKNQVLLFKHLFAMVEELKINKLDSDTIAELLRVNDTEFAERRQAPKKITVNDNENII